MDSSRSAEALARPVPAEPRNTSSEDSQQLTYPDHLDGKLLRVAGLCVLAAMTQTMDSPIVSVAQHVLVSAFGATEAVVAWTVTAHIFAMAMVIPLSGWGADRYGTKRLFISGVLIFSLGSVLCAMAPNISLLIVFRVVSGFGGGILLPLIIAIITREAGPRRLGRLMAVLGIPMLVGPICAPILGGWLIDSYGWGWIFWIYLPIGLITSILAAIVLPKDQPKSSKPFDFLGLLLLSPGLATFLYGMSSIPDRGTDPHVWVPTTIGFVLIAGFVLHAVYGTKHPLIDFHLLRNRVVAFANLTMFLYAAAISGVGLLIPSYFEDVSTHTSLGAGMCMAATGLGAMLTIPIAGAIVDKRGPGKVLLVGGLIVTAGMTLFAIGVILQPHNLPVLLAALAIEGIGMGCTGLPLSTAAVQGLAQHQIAQGSTLISMNQQLAASMGAALTSVILTGQFNRSAYISSAHKMTMLQQDATRRGVAVDSSRVPSETLNPNFANNLLHDLSSAYFMVFLAGVVLMAAMWIPAALLAKESRVSR